MTTPKPFDPDDDFDAACNLLRKGICDLALAADKDPAYARLAPEEQFGALMCGLLAGAVGVLLASSCKGSHDAVMAAIAEYLPVARALDESVTTGEAVH